MPEKPTTRSAKRGEPRKTRRGELRKRLATTRQPKWREWITQPDRWPIAAIIVGYVLVASIVVGSLLGTPILPVGRIMDETRVVRVEFEVEDPDATKRERDLVELGAPLVCAADRATLESLHTSLSTLPEVLAAADSFEQVAPEIVEAFSMNEAQFAAFRETAASEVSVGQWRSRVQRLLGELRVTPLLSSADYQLLAKERAERPVELRDGETVLATISKRDALNIGTPGQEAPAGLREDVTSLVNHAGIFGQRAEAATQRIIRDLRPTFVFDEDTTALRREEIVATVAPVMTTYRAGDVIYRQGEELQKNEAQLALTEHERYSAQASPVRRVLSAAAVLGVVSLIAGAVAGFLLVAYRQRMGDPWRAGAMAAMSAVMLAASGWGTVTYPSLAWATALTPTIFFAMLLVIAYDRRIALVAACAQAVLIGISLGLPAGHVATVLVGTMLAGWRLASVRNRNDMVRGGLIVSAGLAATVLLVSLVERPSSFAILSETLADSLSAGFGGFIAMAITLVILPAVERLFDLTTGMTLSELRDPKQPLLRKLQQNAPGTYNHSLNVATLAETASDAIGADGLHAYVGALYHDIGKMNKPDYFVENQPRGFNRHDKLSPAMSLLVIVGHVKDGIELAREYSLPKSLHHYIESHHGATLVEYFYDQAKRQADADDATDRPAEIEYRYPGPKPRTKEAAILMLCDAVESATRAMTEPTPSRIAQLVHALARKRLMDGQFDESNLTLREISVIEEALTKSLCAIYHGRIAYPKAETKPENDFDAADRTDRVSAEQGA